MCFEAAQQAKEAYTGATGSSIPTLLIVLGINLGLAYSILGLRQKVQQLQQRLDA